MLSAKIISIRDLVDIDNTIPSSILCIAQVVDDDPCDDPATFRTNIHSHDRNNVTTFNETYEVTFVSSSAQILIEVFMPRVLEKKLKICETKIPLSAIIEELDSQLAPLPAGLEGSPSEKLEGGTSSKANNGVVSNWYPLHGLTLKAQDPSLDNAEYPVLGEIKINFKRTQNR